MSTTRRTSEPQHLTLSPRRSALIALAGIALSGTVVALQPVTFGLRVLTGDSGEATRQILRALRHRYPDLQADSDPHALAMRAGAAVYLAIGPAAFRAGLAADLDGPLLCLFTSNETYTRLTLAKLGHSKRAPVTAIYAEAAPMHQMQLIRALYRRRVSIGLFLTGNTAHLEPLLRLAARACDLELQIQAVAAGANVVRALSRSRSARVLLAVPDHDLYTAETFRNVLEATYRANQAVIGFSAAMVRAGTLGAAYSSVEDIVAEVGDFAEGLAAGHTAVARYPRYWRVSVNESVARSLNIPIDESVRELGNPAP